MSETPVEEQDTPDSWRAWAMDANMELRRIHGMLNVSRGWDLPAEYVRLCERFDALFERAVPDPPTRPVALPKLAELVTALADRLEAYEGADEWDIACLRDASEALAFKLPAGDPPTFHVRPRVVHRTKTTTADSPGVEVAGTWTGKVGMTVTVPQTEWDWVAVAANGRKLYGSTESYEHKQHAVEQAHSVADPLGANVVIEEG